MIYIYLLKIVNWTMLQIKVNVSYVALSTLIGLDVDLKLFTRCYFIFTANTVNIVDFMSFPELRIEKTVQSSQEYEGIFSLVFLSWRTRITRYSL